MLLNVLCRGIRSITRVDVPPAPKRKQTLVAEQGLLPRGQTRDGSRRRLITLKRETILYLESSCLLNYIYNMYNLVAIFHSRKIQNDINFSNDPMLNYYFPDQQSVSGRDK